VPRPHREQGQIKTVLDVKLHKLEIDTESHRVTIGGPRTIYARYFNWPLGCNRRSVALTHTEVIDVGLAVHRAMEQASVMAHHVQRSPEFPRIYAGFLPGKHDDTENYDFEPTPALERAALSEIDRWLCAGCPRYWRSFTPDRRDPSTSPDLRQKITRPCRSWADVCRALGDTGNEYLRPDTDSESRYLLLSFFLNQIREHQGLYLIPVEFLCPSSKHRPLRRAMRLFAYLPPRALRDGDQLAVQVVNAQPAGLVGEKEGFHWDFRGAPAGLEKFFLPAEENFTDILLELTPDAPGAA
jgi:hypothetical protein